MILADNDADYEETRANRDNWMSEWKPKMTFGQLPCLYDGDFQLVQSCAILRYLGRKFGMYGDNDKEKATIDMINDHVEEIRGQYVKMIYQNYEAGKGPFIDELPKKLEPLEKLLGTDGFMVGSKVCWADYNLYDLLNALVVLSPSCLEAFPKLQAYKGRVEARKGVQKRLNSEDCKNMPINGNGKQ